MASIPGGMALGCCYMGMYFDNGLAPRFYPELAAKRLRWTAR